MNIYDWIDQNHLNASFVLDFEEIFQIENVGTFLIIQPKKITDEAGNVHDKLFDESFNLILSDYEQTIAEEIDYFTFCFCGNWYYYHKDDNPQLNPLKYLGRGDVEIDHPYCHLGIHSKYEVCNAVGSFEDYINKAKFLGIDTLGICDHNTLAGTLAFQQACQKNDIKPILGEQVTVKSDKAYQLKLYVKNKKGWQNLLRINKAINVDNDHYIDEKELFTYLKGLVIVIPPDSIDYFNKFNFYQLKNHSEDIFFQLDSVEWKSNERDKQHLLNLKQYFKELHPICSPVLISDSHYVDKEHAHVKNKLNGIGKITNQYQSDDQYFKTLDELFLSLSELFNEKDESQYDIFEESVSNTLEIADKCKFEIQTGKLRLPKYIMTDGERGKYGDVDNMFDELIIEGLVRIGKEDDDEYIERIQYEKSVIDEGGYRDYFLITYDVCREADKRGIVRNLGRGSAASSLCLYCLNVTMIDPLKYDLPFDRFLNSARVKKGLPDVDLDVSSEGREEIKQYIVNKYGYNYTVYIGTYGLLKIKSALKELGKESGVDFQSVNYITGTFPKKVADEPTNMTELFRYANEVTVLKKWIKDHPNVINDVGIVNNSIRNKSIHASAMIIAPKYDDNGNKMEIWDWMPVRSEEGHLVSEYSGNELEDLGFLKEDILGLSQLDKIGEIFKLVKKHYKKDYNFNNIPLDDKKTFWMFEEGYTQDVFQFSGDGMTGFLMDLIPERLDDLIAANALYRPGAMGTGNHLQYVKIKNGERLPQYMWGLEEITKNTYSILTFQEQIMQACVDLAGFSLADADMIRKAIGKKLQDLLDSYRSQFIEGAMKNGGSESDVKKIWEMFESFGEYAFNKCISGDEKFYRPMSSASLKPTIKEMFLIKNNRQYAKNTNHKPLHAKYNREGYGVCFSLNDENKLIKNNIRDIRYAGRKDIYRVTLENDSFIDVTLNHKFPTNNGIKKLENIDIEEDFIFYNEGYKQDVWLYSFLLQKRNEKMGRTKMGEKGLETSLKKIKTIEYLKIDDVYDVEIAGPYHNYVTDKGIVTSNSHAACYTILGYVTMYLKSHYPIAFYTVALQYADDKARIIGEMNRLGEVKVSQPDINESDHIFKPDFKKSKIYWSLVSVKYVGEKAVEKIIEERNKNGKFYSVKEFHDRIDKRVVNKRCITNLIISGAFDEIYKIKNESERIGILREYYDIINEDLPEEFQDQFENHFWILQGKALTGLGFLDYNKILKNIDFSHNLIDPLKFQLEEEIGQERVIAGTVNNIIERRSKNGSFVQLEIDFNAIIVYFTIWNETYKKYRKLLKNVNENNILIANGIVKHDGWKKMNVIHSIEETKIVII